MPENKTWQKYSPEDSVKLSQPRWFNTILIHKTFEGEIASNISLLQRFSFPKHAGTTWSNYYLVYGDVTLTRRLQC